MKFPPRLLGAVIAGLLGASLVAAPSPAAAQGKDAPALDDFASARALFNAGQFAEALPLFRDVYARSSSPNARLYVARCLRKLVRNPEAYDEMAATVREATARAETESKYAQTRDSAAAELALLEPLVGKLVIAVADPPAGMTVELDGRPLDAARWSVPITVEPGNRLVALTPPGGATIRREITVDAHTTKTLALTLPTAAPVVAKVAPVETLSGGMVRKVGFGVAGLGVAGIGLFAITGVLANQKYSELEASCGTQRCVDPKLATTVDQGKLLDTLATSGLVVGAVGLAAGAAMIAFGGPSRVPPSAAIVVLPGGGSIVYAGTF
jgi:PEGA domain-containing protein